jgi:TolB-like protein/DNA-binding winged helix-turn-helix (wHTH) protein/tetratricopeptide (TPR) repeat protein
MPRPDFDTYQLDLRRYELRRADGMTVKLERQPMELLSLLAERRGELVTREEIAAKLWSDGVFVDTERGINNAIRKIRTALHDSPDDPTHLQTVVGKGYRYIGHLEVVGGTTELHQDIAPAAHEAATIPSQSGARWRGRRLLISLGIGFVVILAAALAVWHSRAGASRAPIRSLAVLPLENLSGDPAQDYFADGMTDALITDLAQIGELKVISRTSAMQFKGLHKPLPDIARALDVDAVVEGSVVRSGDKVRISAQLIYAPSDRHLWAESFEGRANDVLSIQDEVARAIAGRVQEKLGPQPKQTTTPRKSVNPEAYEAYLRGLYFFDKREAEASAKSADYFREAIAVAPDFAPAHAGLAEALPAVNWFNGKPPVDAMSEAKAAAKRALELDDKLGAAHTSLGGLLSLYDWNWSAAEKELQRGLELTPNNSLAHERYAMLLQSTGRLSEAVLESKRAQELDPLSFFMNRELGRGLYLARRFDEALKQFRSAAELKPNNEVWISWAYEVQGNTGEAIKLRLQGFVDDVSPSPREISLLQQAYTTAGWKGYWTKWLQLHSSGKGISPYYLALAEARVGHADKAWEWMEKSADEREVWVTWIKVDPLFDGIRSAPGYRRLLRRINLGD